MKKHRREKVVILCGGLGTRIRAETEFRPKPMVEIGHKPILWHVMKIYSFYGFNHFILCLGYKGEMIKEYFLNYELMNSDFTIELGGSRKRTTIHDSHAQENWTVTLADTGHATMTGARLKKIEQYIDTDTFLMTHGDGVANVDLDALRRFHQSHGKIATVTGVRPPSRFGKLVTIGSEVTEFSEKPQVREGYINGAQATNNSLKPMLPQLRGRVNVGYTFFEDTVLDHSAVENGNQYFDTVVTGSMWCEGILRGYGLTNVKTVIQGIDPTIFNPSHSEKEYLRDMFVIFSGGKFEFRKGQDIVMRAFKHIQDKYRNICLINSWFNSWAFSFNTMSMSTHITFSPPSGDDISVMNKVLVDNGINLDGVITLPLYPNIMMPRIYKNTDIGLFPNRCEGGTNLVLMEYMAAENL